MSANPKKYDRDFLNAWGPGPASVNYFQMRLLIAFTQIVAESKPLH